MFAENQLLYEFDALEVHQPRVLFHSPVEWQRNFPGAREHFGVRDGGFVLDVIRRRVRVPLYYPQLAAVVGSRTVEPGLVVKTRNFDYQRVSLPAPDRLPHPRIGFGRSRVFEINVPDRAGVFIGDKELVLILNNLKWKRHVRCARHAWEIALDLRIALQPMLPVFIPQLGGFRLVGYGPAFDNSHATRD